MLLEISVWENCWETCRFQSLHVLLMFFSSKSLGLAPCQNWRAANVASVPHLRNFLYGHRVDDVASSEACIGSLKVGIAHGDQRVETLVDANRDNQRPNACA